MKLFELMMLGNDNQLGRALHDARLNITKLSKHTNSQTRDAAKSILASLDQLEANPNVCQTDGYSVSQYLEQLSNPSIDKRTLLRLSDTLSSFDDSDGE